MIARVEEAPTSAGLYPPKPMPVERDEPPRFTNPPRSLARDVTGVTMSDERGLVPGPDDPFDERKDLGQKTVHTTLWGCGTTLVCRVRALKATKGSAP